MAPRNPTTDYLDDDASPVTRIAVLAVTLGQINQAMTELKTDVKSINEKVDKLGEKYVTQGEFKLVRAVVFGMVGIILAAFLTGLIALVFRTGGS